MDWFTFFWIYVCGILGFAFILIFPWAAPLYWYKAHNLSSRKMYWAARKKKVPAYIAHDSGRAAFTLLTERRGEGIVMTDTGKYKALPRMVSKKPELGQPKERKGKSKGNPTPPKDFYEMTAKQKLKYLKDNFRFDYMTDWIAKRTIDVGTGLPTYIGYSGKLCLFHPLMLALWEAGKLFIPTSKNPFPRGEQKKLPRPLMLLNAREIKTIINKTYDTSQVAAMVTDAEEIGRLGRGVPSWMKYLALILIILIVIFGALYILPKIMV